MKTKLRAKLTFASLVLLSFILLVNASVLTLAYFSKKADIATELKMDVNLVFGRLDDSLNPTGDWGSETNPYLISENRHLHNLYTLQNRANRNLINEDTVFQVSDEFGRPYFIGGTNTANLLNISSIGNEEFPFISTFRGVRTTNTNNYVTLPTGERSDTSVIGNIRVNAVDHQFDIGLFGNVGPATSNGEPVGGLSTLLLYNVQINTTAVGTHNPSHKHFVSSATYETNHIGILVGHAQNTAINEISVYYSGADQNKDVKAFEVNAGTTAKYTTAQGIIGYYTDIIVNDETELPVSSTGIPGTSMQAGAGLGLGIVYAEDLWDFMERNVFGGAPQNNDDYGIKNTFGAELYGSNMPGKKAFNIGVFTFAHSKQSKGDDRLEKIWPNAGEENWQVSSSSSYAQSSVSVGSAKKYFTKRLTSADMQQVGTGTSRYHQVNANIGGINYNSANYRYLLTVPGASGKEYAIMRYGASAIVKEIDPNNFIIPEEDLNYYTYEPLGERTANLNYPPYQSGSSFRYHTRLGTGFRFYGGTGVNYRQFAAYGHDILEPGGNGRYLEGIRPLRVLFLSGATPSVTFNASSSTSIEGVFMVPFNVNRNAIVATTNAPSAQQNNNNYYDSFLVRRTNGANGTPQGYFMTFNESTGLSASNVQNNAVAARIYAVRVTNGNSQDPVNTTYDKIIHSPTANLKNINMSENILMYTGSATSTVPATRYQYDLKPIAALNWSDNDGKPIEKVEKAITTGDATSYYFISGATYPFWGVAENLPSPIEPNGKINVPEGSFGFTVSGTGSANSTSKVFVIVASDPTLDVDQEITISRFGAANSSSQNADRTIVQSMVLPPVPSNEVAKTFPLQVKEVGDVTARQYYPNLNRLLVGYEFTVPSRYTITYFLEASIGIASFVYLSAERIASSDNNPTHENKMMYPHLNGIDFVVKSPTNNNLYTVGSANYESSLSALYFGLKPNPANPFGENENLDAALISVTTGLNFTYGVGRKFDTSEQKYIIYVTIVVQGYQATITKTQLKQIMENYQFEFTEWSYINTETFEYAFSDVIIMRINNYTINDWTSDLA